MIVTTKKSYVIELIRTVSGKILNYVKSTNTLHVKMQAELCGHEIVGTRTPLVQILGLDLTD